MIIGIYAILGLAQGTVMAIDAIRLTGERGHLVGDVPALLMTGVLLLLLAPRSQVSDVT
jgi:hypothetical protein